MDRSATSPDFRDLYRTHFDFVWRNLRALGVPHADLEDATQETFVVAYRRQDAFDPAASIRGWLYGIARRIAFRQRRGGGRRSRLHDAVAREPLANASLDDGVERRDGWRLLSSFIEGLPAPQRDAFLLLELEGMTAAEAGRAMGVSSNTISSRLRTARAAFDRYVTTLRAREAGLESRLERAALQRSGTPTVSQRRRVAALLAVDLGQQAPWAGLSVLKPIAAIVGLGVSVSVVALVVGNREPTPPSPPAPSRQDTNAEQVVARTSPLPTTPTAASPQTPPLAPRLSPQSPRAVSKSTPRPSTPSSTDELAVEAALLRRIRATLDTNAADALRLAQRYEREHPHGSLAIEVHTLRAKALCRMGRDSDARKWAQTTVKASPDGPAAKISRDGCTSMDTRAPAILRPTHSSD